MQIDKKIELPHGTITFKGEVSDQELDHLITMGLIYCAMSGQIPVRGMENSENIILPEGEQIH